MIHPADEAVGRTIRVARERRGLTQGDLAKACGCTFQQIQKYETGKNRVSAGRIVQIAGAIGCHPGALFAEVEGLSPYGHPRAHHEAERLAVQIGTLGLTQRRAIANIVESMAAVAAIAEAKEDAA